MVIRRLLLSTLLLATPAYAQVQPAPAAPQADDMSALELRANQAFLGEDYATALPLLKELAVRYRAQPDKLGPVMEKINVAEANLGTDVAAGVPTLEERTPHAPIAEGEIREFTIKDLGNFPFDPETNTPLPDDVKALDGQTVRLRGYMITLQASGDRVRQFALVPDLFSCCFGAPPQLQHTVIVNTPPGKSVAYYANEIMCTGTLNVEAKADGDFVVSLFEMDVTSIKPAAE